MKDGVGAAVAMGVGLAVGTTTGVPVSLAKGVAKPSCVLSPHAEETNPAINARKERATPTCRQSWAAALDIT
ncbi:MAG: hypothetical protein WBD55_12435 [Dehalococcoidia bacterium]